MNRERLHDPVLAQVAHRAERRSPVQYETAAHSETGALQLSDKPSGCRYPIGRGIQGKAYGRKRSAAGRRGKE